MVPVNEKRPRRKNPPRPPRRNGTWSNTAGLNSQLVFNVYPDRPDERDLTFEDNAKKTMRHTLFKYDKGELLTTPPFPLCLTFNGANHSESLWFLS